MWNRVLLALLSCTLVTNAATPPQRARARAVSHHRPVRHTTSTRTPATTTARSSGPGLPTGAKQTFAATAYTQHGTTSSGKITTEGRTVAADPKVLPPGSHVQVSNAGVYSGVYSVQDQGSAIKGKKIDLYIPHPQAAKQFGKKEVEVKVISKPKPADASAPPPTAPQRAQ